MDELNVPSFIPQSPSNITVEERRVGFGRRFGAMFLDFLITMIVSVVLYFTIGDMVRAIGEEAINASMAQQGQSLEDLPGEMGGWVSAMGAFTALSTISGLLLSLVELFAGATLGKMLLSIQIAHPDGRKGNIALWFKRWLVKESYAVLSALGFFLMIPILSTISQGIGFIYLAGCFFALSSKKQALHDIIASTAVFRNEDIVNEI